MRTETISPPKMVRPGTPNLGTAAVTTSPECLIVGLELDDASWVAAEAKAAGLKTRVVPIEQLATVNRECWSTVALVVNVDAFDLGDIVDTLIAFRRNAPEVSVIILSAAFGGDEFQGERKAICDISLRLPLSFRRVQRAFGNNI